MSLLHSRPTADLQQERSNRVNPLQEGDGCAVDCLQSCCDHAASVSSVPGLYPSGLLQTSNRPINDIAGFITRFIISTLYHRHGRIHTSRTRVPSLTIDMRLPMTKLFVLLLSHLSATVSLLHEHLASSIHSSSTDGNLNSKPRFWADEYSVKSRSTLGESDLLNVQQEETIRNLKKCKLHDE